MSSTIRYISILLISFISITAIGQNRQSITYTLELAPDSNYVILTDTAGQQRYVPLDSIDNSYRIQLNANGQHSGYYLDKDYPILNFNDTEGVNWDFEWQANNEGNSYYFIWDEPAMLDLFDIQELSKSGATISLERGSSVTLLDDDPLNELIDSVKLNGTNLEIYDASGVNSIDLSTISSPGYFAPNGDNIYNVNTDNVGIGTSTPMTKLHIDAADATLRLSEPGNPGTFDIKQLNDATTIITKETSSGNSVLDINVSPLDNASGALLRLFRNTETSGATGIQVFRGDNTATLSTFLNANGHSYINANRGYVGIGIAAPADTLDVNGTLRVRRPYDGSDSFTFNTIAVLNVDGQMGERSYSDINLTEFNNDLTISDNQQLTKVGDSLLLDRSTSVYLADDDPTNELFDSTHVYSAIDDTASAIRADIPTSLTDADWTTTGNDMYSTPSGSVGIGTSTPLAKLHVEGSTEIAGSFLNVGRGVGTSDASLKFGKSRGGNGNAYIDIISDESSYSGYGLRFIRSPTGASSVLHRGTDPLAFRTVDAGDIQLYTSNAFRMVVKSNGDVGIGAAAPTAKLDVNGAMRIRSVLQDNTNTKILSVDATGNVEYVDKSSITGDGYVNGVSVSGTTTKTITLTRSGGLGNLTASWTDISGSGGDGNDYLTGVTHSAGTLTFAVQNQSDPTLDLSTIELSRFDDDITLWSESSTNLYPSTLANNVGVGTASPTEKLHVLGNALITSNIVSGSNAGTGNANIRIGSDRTGDGNAYIDLVSDVSSYPGYGLRIIRSGAGGTSLLNRGTAAISIKTVDAADIQLYTNNTYRMGITSAGNVGIGTASPSAKLEVSGTVRLSSLTNDNTLTRLMVTDGDGDVFYRNYGSLGIFSGNYTDLDFSSTTGLSDGVDDVDDADADPTNEYNTNLSLSGTTLQLSDGGGTLSQNLISLRDGNNLVTSVNVSGGSTKTITLVRAGLPDLTDTWTDLQGANQTLAYNPITDEITIAGGNTIDITEVNTNLSQEQVQDYVGAMVSGNTEDGITVTYDDANNEFDFVVADQAWSQITGIPAGFADGIDNVNDADASPTNELQNLSYNAGTGNLTITSGNTVNIGGGGDSDWYEIGTTSAPNDITDNIFTQGIVTINSNNTSTNYPLNVYGKTGQSIVQRLTRSGSDNNLTTYYDHPTGTDWVIGTNTTTQSFNISNGTNFNNGRLKILASGQAGVNIGNTTPSAAWHIKRATGSTDLRVDNTLSTTNNTTQATWHVESDVDNGLLHRQDWQYVSDDLPAFPSGTQRLTLNAANMRVYRRYDDSTNASMMISVGFFKNPTSGSPYGGYGSDRMEFMQRGGVRLPEYADGSNHLFKDPVGARLSYEDKIEGVLTVDNEGLIVPQHIHQLYDQAMRTNSSSTVSMSEGDTYIELTNISFAQTLQLPDNRDIWQGKIVYVKCSDGDSFSLDPTGTTTLEGSSATKTITGSGNGVAVTLIMNEAGQWMIIGKYEGG